MSTVEHVLAAQCTLGEGPVWHATEQKLYWVDIPEGKVHTYHPESGAHQSFKLSDTMAALGICANGGFVVADRKRFAFWDGSSEDLDPIVEVESDIPQNRFNDGAMDPQGRFWVGTMGPDFGGSLYRLNHDLSINKMETNVSTSNGMGWSPDGTIMYYTDSDTHTIYAYDYDGETGAITNRRDFLHNPDKPGVPDGMTVDSEGCIWTARWDGFNLTRYTPDGEVDRVVELPVARITSCTFGGPDLRDLYITCADNGLTAEQRAAQPLAGDIFKLRVDVPGQPEPVFKG